MSLQATNLSVLAYANNFTLWHYTTTDSAITGTGYFNNARDMLRVNDLIIANVATATKPRVRFYTVTKSESAGVSIADMQGGEVEPAKPEAFDWSTVKPGMAFTHEVLWSGAVRNFVCMNPLSADEAIFSAPNGGDVVRWVISGPEELVRVPGRDMALPR